MNKNEKFHGAEFEVNAQAITDEQLDAVSGGGLTTNSDGAVRCPNCSAWLPYFSDCHRYGECVSEQLFDPMRNS